MTPIAKLKKLVKLGIKKSIPINDILKLLYLSNVTLQISRVLNRTHNV